MVFGRILLFVTTLGQAGPHRGAGAGGRVQRLVRPLLLHGGSPQEAEGGLHHGGGQGQPRTRLLRPHRGAGSVQEGSSTNMVLSFFQRRNYPLAIHCNECHFRLFLSSGIPTALLRGANRPLLTKLFHNELALEREGRMPVYIDYKSHR